MLQYFLDDFWNFEHFVKIWTRGLPNYYQITSKYKKNVESSLKNIIFIYLSALRAEPATVLFILVVADK